jgi:malic enzyme
VTQRFAAGSTQEVDRVVAVVENISPAFGGINLEDISSPRCFDIERLLCERLDIPVFHDDQHGTAVVALAALINALKIADRQLDQVKIVSNGAGASPIAVTKLLIGAPKSSSGSPGPTSSPGTWLRTMAGNPTVFALANPNPGIHLR